MDETDFCWILQKPDYLPWFLKDVRMWASVYSPSPSFGDIGTRAKWILLDQGLAATPSLVHSVRENRGSFTSAVRTYRMPTREEYVQALIRAMGELGIPVSMDEAMNKKEEVQ